jgi:hypothetical protein
MKNYQVILMSIVSGGVFWGITYGPLPTMLPFAGPENELGCAVIAGTMCILSLFGIDYKKLINGFN